MTTPRSNPDEVLHTLPKEARLRHPADFDRVYRHRRSVSDPVLILYARPNDLPQTRLGLSVSRKVGNAVHRNRWKRRLREAFRLTRHELPSGLDLIAIPRGPEPPQLDVLCASLLRLARRVDKRAREN